MKRGALIAVGCLAAAWPSAAVARPKAPPVPPGSLAANHNAASAITRLLPNAKPARWPTVFGDAFNGTQLNPNRWVALQGWKISNMTTSAANVSVAGGDLTLTLANGASGAEVDSSPADGAGSDGYDVPVGALVAASIDFPGHGRTVNDWPAFWLSGPNWPTAGENDIAEGLGTMTVDYHSPALNDEFGTIPGTWTNGFHTYALYRGRDYVAVFWNWKLVALYPTQDDGAPEAILLTIGSGFGPAVYGAGGGQPKVNWIRAWQPE